MRYSLPAAVPLPFPPAPPTWKPLQQGSFFHITDYETMHCSMFASLGHPPHHHHHPVAGSIMQPKSTEDLNRMPFTNLTNTSSPNIMRNEKGSPDDSPPRKKSHTTVNTTSKAPSNDKGSPNDSPSHKKNPVAVKSNEPSNAQPNKLVAQNKVWHENMSFTKHKVLKNGTQYRCSSWKSEPDCTAILNNDKIQCSGKHTPGC
jgi:hypothetical protein